MDRDKRMPHEIARSDNCNQLAHKILCSEMEFHVEDLLSDNRVDCNEFQTTRADREKRGEKKAICT